MNVMDDRFDLSVKMEYNHPLPETLQRYPTVGGGEGYDPNSFTEPNLPCGPRIRAGDADRVIETASAFRNAVESAAAGEVVWVPGHLELDVTGLKNLQPAANVVVASDRGIDGSAGAVLSASESVHPFLKLRGDGARITGLRFDFPVTTKGTHSHDGTGTGVAVDAANVEIDNCVFRGFSHAGVETGREGYVGGTHVHHSHFVDNPKDGLGYGVVVYGGDPLIQANYFDNNRHAIAADGSKDCAYTAYRNFCGPHTVSHTLDMHAGSDGQGGRRFDIIQNVILATERKDGHVESGIYIRGNPLEESVIAHNQFAHASKPDGTGDWGDAYELSVSSVEGSNVVPGHNHYGQTDPSPIPEH